MCRGSIFVSAHRVPVVARLSCRLRGMSGATTRTAGTDTCAAQRERVLALADPIVPGQGPAFTPRWDAEPPRPRCPTSFRRFACQIGRRAGGRGGSSRARFPPCMEVAAPLAGAYFYSRSRVGRSRRLLPCVSLSVRPRTSDDVSGPSDWMSPHHPFRGRPGVDSREWLSARLLLGEHRATHQHGPTSIRGACSDTAAAGEREGGARGGRLPPRTRARRRPRLLRLGWHARPTDRLPAPPHRSGPEVPARGAAVR